MYFTGYRTPLYNLIQSRRVLPLGMLVNLIMKFYIDYLVLPEVEWFEANSWRSATIELAVGKRPAPAPTYNDRPVFENRLWQISTDPDWTIQLRLRSLLHLHEQVDLIEVPNKWASLDTNIYHNRGNAKSHMLFILWITRHNFFRNTQQLYCMLQHFGWPSQIRAHYHSYHIQNRCLWFYKFLDKEPLTHLEWKCDNCIYHERTNCYSESQFRQNAQLRPRIPPSHISRWVSFCIS